VIYLQKAKYAKRIYGVCPHIKINSDGYKEEGITYPSILMQSNLLREFYNECGIPTSSLDYIEAHDTGTKVGDVQEVNAIHDVFCSNREIPLMIGSVKANLGHGEPASVVVPYHSSYLTSAKAELLLNLNKIILLQPKKRSSKWISTSIPRTEWFDSASKLSSTIIHIV